MMILLSVGIGSNVTAILTQAENQDIVEMQ